MSSVENEKVEELKKENENLRHQKNSAWGTTLAVSGIVLLLVHGEIGGTPVTDFVSGLLLGISIVVMLVGIFVCARGLAKQKK